GRIAAVDVEVGSLEVPRLGDLVDLEVEVVGKTGQRLRRTHVPLDAPFFDALVELLGRQAIADMLDVARAGAGDVDAAVDLDMGDGAGAAREDQRQHVIGEARIDAGAGDRNAVRLRGGVEVGGELR